MRSALLHAAATTALASFVLVASAALAQEPADGPEPGAGRAAGEVSIADVLADAVRTGRLERATGEQRFRDEQGNLVVVLVKLEGAGGERVLRSGFEHLGVGLMRVERLRLSSAVGLDGRTREVGYELVRGRDQSVARGTPSGEQLRLRIRNQRGEGPPDEQVHELPWSADAAPFTFVTFVLPRLLAAEPLELRFRLYEPVAGTLAEEPTVLRAGAPDADGVRTVRLDHGAAGEDVVRVDPEGQIVSVSLRGATQLTPISGEEAATLREGAAKTPGATGED